MDPQSYKKTLLDTLYAPYVHCVACPLGTLGRNSVVFGEGNPDARLMFIGEGPGADEDMQNRPFIGRSGRLLTATLEKFNISRKEVYITNIVKCRPPNNRKPTEQESTICKNILLLNQIKIIRPTVICTLGSSALAGLLQKEVKITQMRGIPIPAKTLVIFPTYHPAYILRNARELNTFCDDIDTAIKLAYKK